MKFCAALSSAVAFTNWYSSSAWNATAWLAGMVQGVVVQITMSVRSATSTPKRVDKSAKSTTVKPTSIASDFLTSYSTSASANDEPQSKHQLTGFRPGSI